ncbi:DNA-directed DNA polymerase [Flavobacteriaceae bacterium UJ101]|nr:DNA-directed DNA polymerase [Flavobacteriaceae bacterium UJ101]
MYLIFDTETTGLPKDFNAPITDTDNWPRAIQIAWQLHDEWGQLIEHKDFLIKPDGFDIPYDSEQIHGISTALAQEQGVDLEKVLKEFNDALARSKFVVGQNVGFDVNVMGCEYFRMNTETSMTSLPVLDTCNEDTANLCKIPGGRGGRYKLPTLTELHQHLFHKPFSEAHNATADVEATTRCFFELMRVTEVYAPEELQNGPQYLVEFRQRNTEEFNTVGLKHLNLKKESAKLATSSDSDISKEDLKDNIARLKESQFAHLHNHTQFSILQSTIQIGAIVDKAVEEKMPAVAMTDTGNMMAAFHFVKAVSGHNKKVLEKKKQAEENGEAFNEQTIKPIVGCEFFVCENHLDKTKKDNGYQVVMLAKNKNGYHNLAKMSSIAYVEGFYYVPRIDRKIIEQYKEDIIVLTGNLYGEIPSKILNVGEKQAEEALLWWKEQFGEDLYIEIMRHNQDDEKRANETLLRFSKEHNVKLIATNNTYYLDKKDAEAHDILLCVKDGEKKDTPIGRGRGYRYGLPNQEYYFKSQDQMKDLFKDLPEAILNIQEIVDKIEPFILARDVLLPAFDIPEEFISKEDQLDGGKRGENAFLRHLTYEGAKIRYSEITEEIRERLDFELEVIEKTGYPGYFLIVEDFIREARKMGVSVGPGRGSAAGSAVAYCLWITNLDPIQYDLLFERFLNPDRVSMPDIDIDFDDEGRQKVIDYVIDKYGASQVAQIITYGTMAAKSAIRDTARALDLDLGSADRLAKLVPDMKLKKLFGFSKEELETKLKTSPDLLQNANELINISKGQGSSLEVETVNQARVLEGSLRNTGIHACGVIITPDDITKFVPVARAKDSDLYVTQFDNSVVESAGLLKMDFLGLKTLTLIKDAVQFVKERHGIEIIPDEIPIDDEKTYELFQRGETVGIFQYESAGMQKYMRELKPSVFADLIAMNALYRPGPIEYIPSFIKRKHGDEEIVYDLEASKEYLEETYGITVYQEQVMLLSQKLANFTKGEADVLRKAMGKKILSLLEELKPKFVNGGKANGHDEKTLNKIWKDWEAFASYAFNKSHSTCYAWIAYQTAYFKAHYPSEYMASVLSNNMNDIKSVTFFMEECKRMGIEVLGPDINESNYRFTVNDRGAIRFGMGAVKGVGEGAVAAIVKERKENGLYNSVVDAVKRIDLRAANKRAFENLAYAGAFEGFGNITRAQFFHIEKETTTLEKIIKFGQKYQESKLMAQSSLFGEALDDSIAEPVIPKCDDWPTMLRLSKEKEVVGIYITSHPLDDYKHEIEHFTNMTLDQLDGNEAMLVGKEMTFAGIVTDVQHRTSARTGKDFAILTIEDYKGSKDFMLFGEEYLRMRHFLVLEKFLHFKVTVTPKRNGDGFYTNIKSIQLLQDVMENYAKSISLIIEINDLTDTMALELTELIKNSEGEGQIKLIVHDERSGTYMNLPSRKEKVAIDKHFINQLHTISGVQYKLN